MADQRDGIAGREESAEPPIRVEALVEQCLGDTTIVVRVLDKLEKQLEDDLRAIEASLPTYDIAMVARTAHALKGAAGTAAAEALESAAAAVETLARAGSLRGTEAEVVRLREEVSRCIGYVEEAKRIMRSLPSTNAEAE